MNLGFRTVLAPSNPIKDPWWLGLARLLLFTGLALGLSMGEPAPALAATATKASLEAQTTPIGLPTRTELEARIKEAESAKGLEEAARKSLLDVYRGALSYLDSAQEYAAKASKFGRALEEAPKQTAEIRKALANQDDPQTTSPAALATLSSDDLSQQLSKTSTEATATETRITEIDKTIDGSGARTTEVRRRVADITQEMDQLEEESRATPPSSQSHQATQAAAWLLATQRQALKVEFKALEQELASQVVRDELNRMQREQLILDMRRLKERQTQLQGEVDQRRKREAEQAQRETEAAQRAAANKHSLVQQAAKENAELTDTLSDLAGQLDRINDQLTQIEQERKRIEGDFRGARERIDAAGVNQALGLVLIEQRQSLPIMRRLRKDIAVRNDKIADATLRQIHIRELQRNLRDLDDTLDELTAHDANANTDEVRNELRELLEQRRTLNTKALIALDAYIAKQVEINTAADKLIQSATSYNDFLDQHLLWVRSNDTLSLNNLSTLPRGLAWFFDWDNWVEVVQVLGYEFQHTPLSWLGLAAVLLLFVRQAPIKRAILATAEPLRRISTDRFAYTLKAIGLTCLAALPLSLGCLLLGRALSVSIEASDFTRAIGTGLIKVSLGLYYLRLFRLTCMPGGVADRHFRWKTEVLIRIRWHLGWFTPFIILVALLAYSIYGSQDMSNNEALARLASIANMLGTAIFLGILLHPRTGVMAGMLAANPEGWANRLRNLWYPILVGLPTALTVLAILGYLYTAGILFVSLVETAWLTLGLMMVQQVIVRWLVSTRRRLALQAALERQAARRAQNATSDDEGTDNPPPVEEPEADLASLDEQTRQLLSASIFMLAILGLWLIWSPMFPALTIFKKLTLWHFTSLVDGAQQMVEVTAADAGLVLVILFVALVAARNLPALIEILLLQSNSVDAGMRYTVRTLLSYTITAIAALMAFYALGLRWSQVQWLVAALSVGIGFGLQEIVANFISGIIILFERPIRVGDTVTIGTTTGIVTKIEIRATTIRNWDRQELIVPNKEFITGRLLNWTLSDQLNRIVITVGIEYGSDVRLALSLLTETAAANPRVLKDPAPLATLDAFGDNSLTLVLRCYLETMDVRQAVTTEMHLAIEEAFREHGIGIAFPQREICIRASEPIDVRLGQATNNAGAASMAGHVQTVPA